MFQEEFGIPIGHRYGPSEVGLAYCCRTGHGFHFYPTYGQVDYFPEPEGCQSIVGASFSRDPADLRESAPGKGSSSSTFRGIQRSPSGKRKYLWTTAKLRTRASSLTSHKVPTTATARTHNTGAVTTR